MAARLILDRYRPIGTAGSGGFGTVQVAWDTLIQRKVAIKCIELSGTDASRIAHVGRRAVGSSRTTSLLDGPDDAPVRIHDDAAAAADATERMPSRKRPAHAREPVEFDDYLDDEPPFDADSDADDEAALRERWLADVPGLDEARTAALLQDPNIVTVYNFDMQGTTAYLIMEYVDGPTLGQVLREHDDRITLDVIASVLADVSHALEVAHGNQVLHLDIKPDNILIDRAGCAKVTDFGLATLANAQGEGTASAGTIGYMPLEQMRRQALDARTDEWSLASVVYEMLSGENPFRAKSLRAAEEAAQSAELVLPSLCWDDLDERADDVLFYALDPDPGERYETVAEFADELAPYLGDPKRGRRQLAALVSGDDDVGDEDEAAELAEAPRKKRRRERGPRTPVRELLTPRVVGVCARAMAAVGSAFVASLAAPLLPLPESVADVALWPIAVAFAAAGALVPRIAALVALCALGVGIVFAQAPAVGIVLVAAVIAWWMASGRFSRVACNTALAFPLLGAVGVPLVGLQGFAAAAPVAAGAFLRLRDALATVALGFVVMVALSCVGAGGPGGFDAGALWSGEVVQRIEATELGAGGFAATVLSHSETWAAFVGWLACAGVVSLGCLRGGRVAACLGTVGGIVAAGVCACAGVSIATGFETFFADATAIVPTVVGGIIAIAGFVVVRVPERVPIEWAHHRRHDRFAGDDEAL